MKTERTNTCKNCKGWFMRIFFCRRGKHRYSSMGYYGNTAWCKDCGKEKHYTPVGLRQ